MIGKRQAKAYRKFNFAIRNIFSKAKKVKVIQVSNLGMVKITHFIRKTDI